MALERQAGAAYIKVDDEQLALKGEIEIDPTESTREPIVGLDGVHGWKETPKAPSITVKVTKTKGLSLKRIAGWTGKTVTAELASGTVYVLADAFQAGDLKLNGDEGDVSITFFGLTCREL
ncbi:phage tail tube protein [Neoroseomonas lacus]|uniref:Phage tail protein n=1 Tax=Neoroseomonas lacus TaxID=287609 RepID=A0A917KLE3_9PROT|nr:phage tail tube protein [Neoroseomonas lacus]GGJ14224.1 phage tail protein [Neoroseomonas lacus]